MAAPEYVPSKPMDDVRTYESPPRRPDSWRALRPGDLKGSNPRGAHFGNPGPDQGYGLTLAHRLTDKLHLVPGEELADVVVGCVGVGLKRASLLGRAPVIFDLIAAYTVWGFLDPKPSDELVALRQRAFDGVALSPHYEERLHIVAAVLEDGLCKMHTAIADLYAVDWRQLFDPEVLDHFRHA